MVGIYPLWEARKGIWGVSLCLFYKRFPADWRRFVPLSQRTFDQESENRRLTQYRGSIDLVRCLICSYNGYKMHPLQNTSGRKTSLQKSCHI